jgi:DNA-binding SARP family transcriptional activator
MSAGTLVSLTGPFAIRTGQARKRLSLSGSTLRLLVLLAGHFNSELRRESLIAGVWPDSELSKGNSSLNTALWRIRGCLADSEGLELLCLDEIVQLTVSPPARVDVDHLRAAVGEGTGSLPTGPISPEHRAALASAVELCRGEFLEGCSEHWVLPMREHYGALHICALAILMRDAAMQEQVEAALHYGRGILAIDPFREVTQREVMRLYLRNGQRAQALRQYEFLRTLLRDELGIDPMDDTTALFRGISNNDPQLLSGRDHNLGDRPAWVGV